LRIKFEKKNRIDPTGMMARIFGNREVQLSANRYRFDDFL